jgi:peptidoglycan/xylan/chitin deacetylase (PgdA/CDA1 family)
MYHRIADIPGDRNALPKEKFAEQLEYLSTHNYHTITPEQLYNHFVNKAKLPKNPILLTFDDGYQDNYLEALPLLKKYNMTAVVFPIYNWIGKPNKWENFGKQETTTMNLEELKSWLHYGLDIQPHTADHPFLTQCNEEKLNLEIIDTKTKFEKLLDKPMDYLCYPYGFFNQQVINIVKKANYKMAFAIFENVPLWHIDLFALPRIPIPSHQKMWEFKLKVSSIHIIFVAMRKWERQFKQIKNKFS